MPTEQLYPWRQRCKACKRFFGFDVIDGLYCSYSCAGLPEPSLDVRDAPRSCKRTVRPHEREVLGDVTWVFKVRYYSEEQVLEFIRTHKGALDEGMVGYHCDYCRHWHLGKQPKRPITPGREAPIVNATDAAKGVNWG